MNKTLHIKEDDHGVVTVWFDHVGKSVNTFTPAALDELDEVISSVEQVTESQRPTGMIFTSAKREVFVSGADLFSISQMGETQLDEFIERGQQLFERIAKLPCPTVAAINGHCLGGGLELALACAGRVVADKGSINIGLPETKLGIVPGWGGTTRLTEILGPARAMALILSGRTMPPRGVLQAGIVDEVVRPEALMAAAQRLIHTGRSLHCSTRSSRLALSMPLISDIICGTARRKAAVATCGNYPAVNAVIDIVAAVCRQGHHAGLRSERKALVRLAKSDVCRNLIRIFALRQNAKRTARNQIDAMPSADSAIDIQQAAVIGGGTMGAGIVHALIGAGIDVRLVEIDEQAASGALRRVANLLYSDVKAKKISPLQSQQAMHRVAPTTISQVQSQQGGLKMVDFVVEAVAERMDVKRQIFQMLDRITASRNGSAAVLASNTSALSITELASTVENPGRVIGMHFFNPVTKMPLVEVVRTHHSHTDALGAGVELAIRLGKTPIIVADAPGFLVNRILIPYLAEALVMVTEGASIMAVDRAMKQWGMPMGPFELLDQIGLDVAVEILKTFRGVLDGRLVVPDGMDQVIERGWLGRKCERGFYVYRRGRHPRVNRQMVGLLAKQVAVNDAATIDARLILPMVNESARLLNEGVVDSTDKIDLATVLGLGLAPFRGGLVNFAQTEGLDQIVNHMDDLAQRYGPRHAPAECLRRIAIAQEPMQALANIDRTGPRQSDMQESAPAA